jgi:hypothetical protein
LQDPVFVPWRHRRRKRFQILCNVSAAREANGDSDPVRVMLGFADAGTQWAMPIQENSAVDDEIAKSSNALE